LLAGTAGINISTRKSAKCANDKHLGIGPVGGVLEPHMVTPELDSLNLAILMRPNGEMHGFEKKFSGATLRLSSCIFVPEAPKPHQHLLFKSKLRIPDGEIWKALNWINQQLVQRPSQVRLSWPAGSRWL
jgi:hypothetical protein